VCSSDLTPTTSSPTNADKVSVAVNFSENVQKLDGEPDLVITQTGTVAHAGAAIGGGPKDYTVDVTGITGDGTIALGVNPQSDVKDIAGNRLASSISSAAVTVDHTRPTLTVAPITPTPTNADAVAFSVVFSEAVAPSFAMEDVALTGTLAAAAAAQIGGADPSYTVTATPNDANANGTLGIVIGAAVADPAGNTLAAGATSPLVTLDNTPPTVTITPATGNPTNADTVGFNVTFSEPVAPTFAMETLALTGTLAAAAKAQIGGTDPAYTVNATLSDPNANGTIGITLGAGIKDLAGNTFASGAASPLIALDNVPPTVTITCATPNPTNANAIVFSVTFSEPVAPTFTLENLALTGTLRAASTAQLSGADPSYSVTVTLKDPSAGGSIGIILNRGATDSAGNVCPGGASAVCTK